MLVYTKDSGSLILRSKTFEVEVPLHIANPRIPLSPTSPTFGNFIGFQLENVAAGAAFLEEQLQIADASISEKKQLVKKSAGKGSKDTSVSDSSEDSSESESSEDSSEDEDERPAKRVKASLATSTSTNGPKPKRPFREMPPKGVVETKEQRDLRRARNVLKDETWRQALFLYDGKEKMQKAVARSNTVARVGITGFKGVVPLEGADPYWKGLLSPSTLTELNGGRKVVVSTVTWEGIPGITHYSTGSTKWGKREVLLYVYKRGPERTDPGKPATNSDEAWIAGIFKTASLAARLMGTIGTQITKACGPRSKTGVSGTYQNCGCHWQYAKEKKAKEEEGVVGEDEEAE